MPEGPEVKIVTNWLQKVCTKAIIVNNSKFPQLNGFTITHVHCKGKQIFFHLSKDPEVVYLNSRLGMTGRWTSTEAKHTRFWMMIQTLGCANMVIYYDDVRNFGDIEIQDQNKYDLKLKSIGPDLLSDKIDPIEWTQKLRNKRIKTKQICDFLLEQKYFSGIGNYLKSEILYICKIKPDRQVQSLTDNEIKLLLEVSLQVIQESYQSGGLTIKDFWSPEGYQGKYCCKVYNKSQDSNGFTVIKDTFKDGRTTHWVTEIQK